MRKITISILFICSFLMLACSSSKDYVKLAGRVPKGIRNITIKSKKAHVDKVVRIDENGLFNDTIKLKEPSYLAIANGETMNVIYVKNGDDIKAVFSSKDFSNGTFSGKGSEETAYMNMKSKMQKNFFGDSLYYKSKDEFQSKLDKYSNIFSVELAKANDSLFKVKQTKYIKTFQKRAKKKYKFKSYLIENLGQGTPAPDFSSPYEANNGKNYSLKDLKGKNIYIKFWATWCGYCKKEAPYFKKLSKKYKNVQFLGISLDKARAKKKWKKMVDKEIYPGIELFSNADKKVKKTYKIQDLPRFMLIDAKGNIIDADAPAPSSVEISEILNQLND